MAGSIAVEYELDPESDALSGDTPLYRREYELKAILQNCSNTGTITGRRDYVGGICGRMDLGLITGCEGGGIVESESGNYIGGIAGFTTAAIRDSFAKCRLSGGKYVGGIVGSAAVEGSVKSVGEVSRCHSLVRITGTKQYAGAISGRPSPYLLNMTCQSSPSSRYKDVKVFHFLWKDEQEFHISHRHHEG